MIFFRGKKIIFNFRDKKNLVFKTQYLNLVFKTLRLSWFDFVQKVCKDIPETYNENDGHSREQEKAGFTVY